MQFDDLRRFVNRVCHSFFKGGFFGREQLGIALRELEVVRLVIFGVMSGFFIVYTKVTGGAL